MAGSRTERHRTDVGGKEYLEDWLLGENLDLEEVDLVEWIRNQALWENIHLLQRHSDHCSTKLRGKPSEVLPDNIPPLVPERVPDGSTPGGVVLRVLWMDAKIHHKLNAVPNVPVAGHAHLVPLLLKADALDWDSDHSDSALPDRLGQEEFVPAPEWDLIDSGPRQL